MRNRIILTLLVFVFTLHSHAQHGGSVLRVQGEARLFVVPELMMIHIPMEVSHSSYNTCSDLLARNYNKLLESLVANGFERSKIKSTGLSINEKYKWVQNNRIKDGYEGRIQMEIEEKHTTEKLNAFIKSLKDDHFDFGYNLSFKLSEEQKGMLLKEAIDKAVADAKNKATLLAKSLDVKLVRIKEVNFDVSQTSISPLMIEDDLMLARSEFSDKNSQDISLEAKAQQLVKSVMVIWKIR